MRFIDWIWHIKGSLTLPPGQSSDEVFGRLDPLFRQNGTSHQRAGDMLTFTKRDQAAQDKMSIFDGGILQVEQARSGTVLRYHLTSRALLFCFLAPLLFLAFGQLTVALGKLEGSKSEAAEKKSQKEAKALPQHPIDKALGAPAPETPKKDEKKGEDDKPSPTAANVFAALFAALYVGGRLLESRLIRSLFQKRLQHAGPAIITNAVK